MPRWAIAQPRMHWTLQGNLREILGALEAAAAAGAEGCVCTELALTGFHRRMPQLLEAQALADAEAQIRAACARLGIATVFGVPTLGGGGCCLQQPPLHRCHGP
ncbi:nitrilase-related carbon-nitrogen hydrolase [Roseateles sp. NT4]|uniref:nitrilase-related carbon-nitrogen hydrolase n=1 Tax=Roseateles sp. NT4 TaxID=3453715 RepID=UPI003EEE44A0